MIGAMGYCTQMGYNEGQIGKLMAPLDADNKFCGFSQGYEEYKFLYFTDMDQISLEDIFNGAVCVKACPAKN